MPNALLIWKHAQIDKLRSINGHPTRLRRARIIQMRHLHLHPAHPWLFLLAFHFAMRHVGFQAVVEIEETHEGIDNGEDDSDDCEDGEGGQGFARG